MYNLITLDRKLKVMKFWKDLKDFILILFLLNLLINTLQGKNELINDLTGLYVPATHYIAINPIKKAEAEAKPEVKEAEFKTISAETTAYSELDSCHYENCVMASGKRAYVGAVACPRDIRLGTRISIDGNPYICEDRTNKDLDGRFDIFMGYGKASHDNAIRYGNKIKDVRIYGME